MLVLVQIRITETHLTFTWASFTSSGRFDTTIFSTG
jgi:hypothetical protein